ncbi:MAG: hypothetical protein IJ308_07400 [Clostridia bacterium]|nr:hypothetical protein [Clostridia bacterium]
MDKIQLLQERKTEISNASKEIREDVLTIIDEGSFVELSAFSFSKSEFYGENATGEGVLTGYATIDGFAFYVVAQNYKVLDGGMTKANCDKIVKCLNAAEKNSVPVLFLLNTHGVQVGEGVTVLEGLGKLFTKCAVNPPRYVIVNGEVYGSAAMLASLAECSIFLENKSVLTVNSPVVLSAKAGKNLTKEEVGGAKALDKTGVPTFIAKDLSDVREKIIAMNALDAEPIIEAELNDCVPALNEAATTENLLSVFESPLELNSTYEPEVKTVIGRIGGISVASVIFDGGDEGIEMNAAKFAKLKDFLKFAYAHELPLVVFGNVKGICPSMCVNNSRVLKEAVEYLEIFNALPTPKISVVFNKAIGLGYTLFASKSIGFDYTCAFANAKIALFDGAQGAQIEFGNSGVDKAALAAKYADENSDPVNAAKDGYIDAIIEPQFVKQYVIASLQMLAE